MMALASLPPFDPLPGFYVAVLVAASAVCAVLNLAV